MSERRIDAEDTNSDTLVISSTGTSPADADEEDEDVATQHMKIQRVVIPRGTALLPPTKPAPGTESMTVLAGTPADAGGAESITAVAKKPASKDALETVTAVAGAAPSPAAKQAAKQAAKPAPAKAGEASAPKAIRGWPAKTQAMPAGPRGGGLPTPAPPSAITHVDTQRRPLDFGGFTDRYETRAILGIGGMGEVQLAKDRLVGRDVALKVMHDGPEATADMRERFVREARIQGQLEHPAIVPVYDLGVDPHGGVFFTMKRIRGQTLQTVLDGLAEGDAQIKAKFSRRKLLTAFRSVCLALDFAHLRGVLHRDLKPANIILGDFGEVYVLDWGLAKVMDQQGPRSADAIELTQDAGQRTAHGSMLGTPGYMSPEQACGELESCDARTDIYSLGALLFEILSGTPLHAQTSLDALIQSTLRGADARPSARGGIEVPPELDVVCVRATAVDPADRFDKARDISDAIEGYLDGDRNVQLRRDLSKSHIAAAHQALEKAARGGETRQAAHALALREVGSALALDPSNTDALRTMARLLMDVPDEVPPEAEAELRTAAALARREAARVGANRFLLWNAFIPLALWMGIRHFSISVAAISAVIICGATSFWMSRRTSVGLPQGFLLLLLSSVTIGMMSALFGPFILVPGQAATNTMFFAANADRPSRRIIVAVGVISIALPFFLDIAGLVPPAYQLVGGQLIVLPRATNFPPLQTMLCLLFTSVAMVVIPGLVMGRMRDALTAAERRIFLQAWHLRQMVPAEAQEGLARKA